MHIYWTLKATDNSMVIRLYSKNEYPWRFIILFQSEVIPDIYSLIIGPSSLLEY